MGLCRHKHFTCYVMEIHQLNFKYSHRVAGSEAHPDSCTVGTEGKARPGRDADHSPLSSAEVESE
jgi:hypothetical protein